MNSKEVRRVILRTARVQPVRSNLRALLKLAVKDKLNRLTKIKRLYHNKDIKDNLTPSQQKRYEFIGIKYRTLSERYNHSTLQCGSGAACYSLDDAIERGLDPRDRPIDLDLVWVPWLRKWFCLKCFVLNRIGEMTYEDFDDPMYSDWVKEEFGI